MIAHSIHSTGGSIDWNTVRYESNGGIEWVVEGSIEALFCLVKASPILTFWDAARKGRGSSAVASLNLRLESGK